MAEVLLLTCLVFGWMIGGRYSRQTAPSKVAVKNDSREPHVHALTLSRCVHARIRSPHPLETGVDFGPFSTTVSDHPLASPDP
jgi:hypothetical protein